MKTEFYVTTGAGDFLLHHAVTGKVETIKGIPFGFHKTKEKKWVATHIPSGLRACEKGSPAYSGFDTLEECRAALFDALPTLRAHLEEKRVLDATRDLAHYVALVEG